MENIKTGDCFIIKGWGTDWHILSQVLPGKVTLVSLQDKSNRFVEPQPVVDVDHITLDEFCGCLGSTEKNVETILQTKTSIKDLLTGVTGLKLPVGLWKIE